MAIHAPSTPHHIARRPCDPNVVAAPPSQAPEATFDRDYWVGNCQGYRVDGHAGRIGVVEEVQPDPTQPSRNFLSIRAGLLGRRIIVLSSDEIEFIVPRAERIWLRTPLTILCTQAA